jgi:hypothetical protein
MSASRLTVYDVAFNARCMLHGDSKPDSFFAWLTSVTWDLPAGVDPQRDAIVASLQLTWAEWTSGHRTDDEARSLIAAALPPEEPCVCAPEPVPTMQSESTLRVVRAAIVSGGVLYSLPPPARHFHVMTHMQHAHGFKYMRGEDQGFVLSDGTFADRKRAHRIAKARGQLIEFQGWVRDTDGRDLFSEDLF